MDCSQAFGTTLCGDGVYRAKLDGNSWISDVILGGANKVIDAENNKIYGLTTDGAGNLLYYREKTKHVYKYNISNSTETDLMSTFVPQEDPVVMTTWYENMVEHNGELYYINLLDDGKLYKYNIDTNQHFRLTSLEVADFAFNDGFIYYATLRWFVNFDLYRMELSSGTLERISTDKCFNLVFVGDKIYYTNFSGKDSIDRMNLDGSNNESIYGKDVTNPVSNKKGTTVHNYPVYHQNGKIYFAATRSAFGGASPSLYEYNISTNVVIEHGASTPNRFFPKEYMIIGDNFYGIDTDGKNSFIKYNLLIGTVYEVANLVRSSLGHDDARSLFVYNNNLYFFRNSYYPLAGAGSEDSPNKGIYKVSLQSSEPTAILSNPMSNYYVASPVVIGTKLYFIDAWMFLEGIPKGSGFLYSMDLNTQEIIKLS